MNDFGEQVCAGSLECGAGQFQQRTSHATGILLQSTSDIVISGNQFSGLIGPAIRNEGKSKRLSITGNIVTDLKQSLAGKTEAFSLGKPTSSVIKDNILADK